jgi:pimeloyl-ACP methyl ester carboxylesterase
MTSALHSYVQQMLEGSPLAQATLAISVFWVMLEIAFIIVLYYVLLPNLHKLKPPVVYHGDIIRTMKRTFDQVHRLDSSSFETFIEGFFNAARFEDVRADDFKSLLSWLMHHKHLEDLSIGEMDEINHVVEYAGGLLPSSKKLKPGRNPAVSHCRMTLEPLPVIHRPLLLYVLANLTEAISNVLFLQSAGFQRLEIDGMTYWYKNQGGDVHPSGNEGSDGTEPLVFMHGISTGWLVYLSMVKALGKNRTMILVDLDAIKIKSLNFDMPTPEQYVSRVNRLLIRHNIERASFVGHSFGSITAGWFVRYFPEKVSHLTLIDPVSLLLGLPNVAYSFLYRKPSTLMEWIIHVTAARELTISYSLRRHFYWHNNNLWLEDIPSRIGIVVGVSSNDEIINAPGVHQYALNCGIERMQKKKLLLQSAHREDSPRSPVQQVSAEDICGLASPRRITRSMSGRRAGDSAPSTPALVRTARATSRSSPGVAAIESVIWDGYSHGQILLPGETQRKFIELVHTNEKLGTTH